MEMDPVPALQTSHPHGVKRPGDPYEFDEEGGGATCNMEGFARVAGGPKEESKDLKKATGNLFTSEGLQPSYKDLDQIFDNSDDTSGDEAVSIFQFIIMFYFLYKWFLKASSTNSTWFK